MYAHPNKVPSAIERYQKETVRVLTVLDGVLATREWLVGGKMTAADLAFYQWNAAVFNSLIKDYFDTEKELPHVWA